jgi:hypothetical protein
MSKKYGIFENIGAGLAYVDFADAKPESSYYNLIETFDTREEAEDYIEKKKKETTIWAVFFDLGAAEGFVSEENDYSGNWRGNKYPHYTLEGEFDTEEEAENYLQSLLE